MYVRSKLAHIITYALLVMGSIFCLLPFVWLIRSSLMNMQQIFQLPPIWIPSPFQWENYSNALTTLPFGTYFVNTCVITILSVIGVTLSSSVSAFGFTRMRWPGRDAIFGILLTSMMLPYAITLIPTFIGWKFLGGINTFYPLIVPSWFAPAFNVFLLRQFYLTLPRELDEAAFVDGASYITVFSRIILPLTKPALVVIALFSFLFHWNDFLGPVIYLQDDSKFTLAIGLQQFQGLYNAQWELMMAAATAVIIPPIIVFLFGQRYFIEGITMSGLKG